MAPRSMTDDRMEVNRMTDDYMTGSDNYFENFERGAVYKHARGKTVTENEAVTFCHMVMNTADAHFNDDRMTRAAFGAGRSVVYGGVTMSIVIGLAYQDTGEQVIQELELDNISMKKTVSHGDTLYAYSEVLKKSDIAGETTAGKVTFRHYGVNQNNDVVFQGDRTALIRKRRVEKI